MSPKFTANIKTEPRPLQVSHKFRGGGVVKSTIWSNQLRVKLFLVPEGSTLAVEGLDTNLACFYLEVCALVGVNRHAWLALVFSFVAFTPNCFPAPSSSPHLSPLLPPPVWASFTCRIQSVTDPDRARLSARRPPFEALTHVHVLNMKCVSVLHSSPVCVIVCVCVWLRSVAPL